MYRKCLAAAAAAALLAAAGEASAANACYQAFALNNGASLFFVRLQTRSAGTLVPANEGNTVTPAQNLFEVDGYSTLRTGLIANGRQVVEMSLITGTALVVAGQGAQMSLWRNFGRGEGSFTGFSVLDCGSTTASSTPTSWICRGTSASTGATLGQRARLQAQQGQSGADAAMPRVQGAVELTRSSAARSRGGGEPRLHPFVSSTGTKPP